MRGGRLIREVRRRAGLSQEELAARLGTKQPVVARWETARTSPTFDTIIRAARVCGYEIEPRLHPVDDSDDRSIARCLGLSPKARLTRNRRMLETERWAQRATVVDRSRDA